MKIPMNDDGNKIKILNILTTVEDGGLEMLIYKIYRGLNKEDYDFHICIMTKVIHKSFIYKDFEGLNVKIYNLDFINKNVGLAGLLKNINQIFRLLKLIKLNRFDIVHSHDFFPAFYSRIAVILARLSFSKYPSKVYSTYHNIYYWLKKPHRIINKILSSVTDKIVCVSESAMLDSVEKEKIRIKKFKVIYNGLDPDEFYKDVALGIEYRKKYGYSDNDIIVGNVGVLSVRKGQIYLLKAFNEIYRDIDNLKLVIVGSKRSHELYIYNELTDFIKNNNLKDYVNLVEPIKNVNGIYNMLDIKVMCSITEGFGLSAFEFMLTEKKCIFSDIDVFRELTMNGKFGPLFPNKDYIKLAEILKKEINQYKKNDPALKVYRDFVAKSYNLNDMVVKYDELYRSNS